MPNSIKVDGYKAYFEFKTTYNQKFLEIAFEKTKKIISPK